MVVVKRDGREVPFDKDKIILAVEKAYLQVDNVVTEKAKEKAREIANYISHFDRESVPVEEIQDIVENKLMNSNRKDVAKAYILYRDARSRVRERNSEWMRAIKEKISASNVQNQNANVDEKSFGGRKGEADSELMKKLALDEYLSPMARDNHLNNEIYIHDLDSYVLGNHNCLTIPFDKLLREGFTTRQTDIRPANSVSTAFQLVAVLFQIQSLQQFGGVSAGHIDWTMVPYVRKSFWKHYKNGLIYIEELGLEDYENGYITDNLSIEADIYKTFKRAYQYAMDMTEREIKQSAEALFHNLNSLQSRSGNQLPFSSINYGTCTLPEGRMIIKALIEGTINGTGKFHSTSVFPCCIFQYMKGVNDKPGTPNYDMFRLALKATAQRLYPNYANVDWSGNAGYDPNDPSTYFSTIKFVA